MKNADIQLSKVLGGFSLCLGALELLAGRSIVRKLGLPVPPGVIQAFGAREMFSGFTVLAHPDEAPPIGLRLAGDVMDLVVLGAALMSPRNRRRPTTLFATAAVVGVTLMDLAAGAALQRRSGQALATARRTRVKRIPAAMSPAA